MALTNQEQRQDETARIDLPDHFKAAVSSNGLTAANSFSYEEPDADSDISASVHGAKAIGKRSFSAMRTTQYAESDSAKEAAHKEKEEAELVLARLTAWDNAKVNYGGVEMSNMEALEAGRNVNNNADAYAKWAVQHGYIKAGEEEQFKRTAKRLLELQEEERKLAGKGQKLSPEQQKERSDLQGTPCGQAYTHGIAQNHKDNGWVPNANIQKSDFIDTFSATQNTQQNDNNARATSASKGLDEKSFNAVNLGDSFVQAKNAEKPLDVKSDPEKIAYITPTMNAKNSGMDI